MIDVLDRQVALLVLAAALGLFLGLEREWSEKSAGVRTLALFSLLGALAIIVESDILLGAGALLVVLQGTLLSVQGLFGGREGLSLTTGASMLVAYGVGVLVGSGLVLEGVTVAVVSSLLLVLKRELHALAGSLSRAEVRSASEFAVLAFVVFPLLPTQEVSVALLGVDLAVEPRVVWLLVVTVAAVGICNYGVVTRYGGRGVAVTGFFGGFVSSTAVVGTMLDHVRQHPAAASYAVAAVLLANAAMAARNLALAVGFTLSTGPLTGVIIPLGIVVLGSVAVAAYTADWTEQVEVPLETPFRLRYALGFGAVFLLLVVAGGVANTQFGTVGLLVTAALAGLVSSAGGTTSAVVLYRSGAISAETATLAVLLTTATSIGVKVALTAGATDRGFFRRVAAYSTGLVVLAGAATFVAV
ncbi:MgtC/SapB family protein [Halosegnis sp.]|uniref:MgtC/SapB family protein n=1 Tax=Halosegnis sp. TaxID=2864959 RepID=UPI0035D46750